ncbi:hypothetical protein P7C71_g2713, partial [Lecanoromycetidae sp. Uapishka_2]
MPPIFMEIIPLSEFEAASPSTREYMHRRDQGIEWQQYDHGPVPLKVGLPTEFLHNVPLKFQYGGGGAMIPLYQQPGDGQSDPPAINGTGNKPGNLATQPASGITPTPLMLEIAEKRRKALDNAPRKGSTKLMKTPSPAEQALKAKRNKEQNEEWLKEMRERVKPVLDAVANGTFDEGTASAVNTESTTDSNAPRYLCAGASFLQLTIKVEEGVDRETATEPLNTLAARFSSTNLAPNASSSLENNISGTGSSSSYQVPNGESSLQIASGTGSSSSYQAPDGASSLQITPDTLVTRKRKFQADQTHHKPATKTCVQRVSKPPQNEAIQLLEAAQQQLENIFRAARGQPYNPGWMDDNDVDKNTIKALTCQPSRQHFDVLCREKVILPGDILRVTFTPTDTAAAAIVVDATILTPIINPKTGKSHTSATPNVQVSVGQSRIQNIYSIRGPQHLIEEILDKFSTHLPSINGNKKAWQYIHLIRNGRDYGACSDIRAHFCLWVEQHKALINEGNYPSLFGHRS